MSARPGFLLSQKDRTGMVATALVGRVPVTVNNENGVIKVGDSITISSVEGEGMRADFGDKSIGYALESFSGTNDSTQSDKILVYVSTHIAGESNNFDINTISETNQTASSTGEDQKTETFYTRLVKIVDSFINGVLTLVGIKVEIIETDKLCIGSTCVSESELINLLNPSSNEISPPADEDDPQTPIVGTPPIISPPNISTSTPPESNDREDSTSPSNDSTTENEPVVEDLNAVPPTDIPVI